MRFLLILLAISLPIEAMAERPSKVPVDEREARVEAALPEPCLLPRRGDPEPVRWWIVDTRTGERRAVGSQTVRLRC